jgi:hypothetical protein
LSERADVGGKPHLEAEVGAFEPVVEAMGVFIH